MKIKHPMRIVIIAVLLGWALDLLFWKNPLGINFTIWTILVLAGGIFLVYSEGGKVHPAGWVLTALSLALSAAPLIRLEELTRAVSILLTLLTLLLLILTAKNGFWPLFRLWDWITGGLELLLAAIARGPDLLRSQPAPASETGEPAVKTISPMKRFWNVAWRVLLGLLIALPIVAILGSLLSSADPIFAENLQDFLRLFRLERIPEYLFRLFYILVIAYLIGGLLAQAISPRKEATRPDPEKPPFKGFLGPIETGVILGSVNLLLGLFVAVQFRYFFAGQVNISATGYTFSEYAVRGFNELVTVAVLSLLLYQGLNLIRRSESRGQMLSFRILSVLLFGLVLVILISSWQRLGLYENAYGFTRLRTYTHLFIPWLGALLAVTALLEVINRRGRFALALWLAACGFGLTLMLVNVDGFIVRQNTARAAAGEEFDFDYLSQLSHDAVGAMLEGYNAPGAPDVVRQTLGAQLACRALLMEKADTTAWPGFTLAEAQAQQVLLDPEAQKQWSGYPITIGSSRSEYQVTVNGELHDCSAGYWMD